MKSATILLIDDNLVPGLFVKKVLQDAGYRVWFCIDTTEAWQYYANKNPDLILLNDNHSNDTIYSIAMEIRHVNKIIPIMYFSGRTFEEEWFNNLPRQMPQKEPLVISETALLYNLQQVLPIVMQYNIHIPEYNINNMTLCVPEDILVLTALDEGPIHLHHYVAN
jgi:CheY-like chemotaxis protein